MAILVMVLSIAVFAIFGNQSYLIGGQTKNEAVHYAVLTLEQEQAYGRKDFNLVNATTTTDGFYTSSTTVVFDPDAPFPDNLFSKLVTTTVSWADERGLERSLSLSQLVTNFSDTAGGNTCNSSLPLDWTPTSSSVSTTYPVLAVDAYLHKLYVGEKPSGNGNNFFIYSLSNPSSPSSQAAIDTNDTSTQGINGIAVAATTTAPSAKTYAYLANGVTPDWTTCTPGPTCAQLQIYDVTNPSSPQLIKNFALSTTSYPQISATNGAVAKAVTYSNGLLFLGLTSTNHHGPEFNIIDVHNPLNPVYLGGYEVGATVNQIDIRGNYAYLATASSSAVMTILNVSNPTAPVQARTGVVPPSMGAGESEAVVGDTIYFGKAADNNTNEFYSINNPDPGATAPVATQRAETNSSIWGMIVRSYMAFLVTSSSLRLYNLDTNQFGTSIPLAGGAGGDAIDCENEHIYVGSQSGITIVTGS